MKYILLLPLLIALVAVQGCETVTCTQSACSDVFRVTVVQNIGSPTEPGSYFLRFEIADTGETFEAGEALVTGGEPGEVSCSGAGLCGQDGQLIFDISELLRIPGKAEISQAPHEIRFFVTSDGALLADRLVHPTYESYWCNGPSIDCNTSQSYIAEVTLIVDEPEGTDTDTATDTDSETADDEECYEGDFTIETEEDAEYFAQFPCITGDLTIVPSSLASLSLPELEEVEGSLVVDGGVELASLELEALTLVGGDLDLSHSLVHLDLTDLFAVGGSVELGLGFLEDGIDLPSLVVVGKSLFIEWGSAPSVDLPALTTVGEGIIVEVDSTIESLTAPNLTSVDWVHFCYAGELSNTNIFASLTSIDSVHIHGTKLNSLEGAGGFDSLSGILRLYDNPYLTNLEAFSGVTWIGGDLRISGNGWLGDLDDLDSLTSVGGSIAIYDNPYLPYCEVCDLLAQLDDFDEELECYGNYDDLCWNTALECPEPDPEPDAGPDGGE